MIKKKLDELLVDDIEEGPGLGCTSPVVNKSVHNQSKAIANAPSKHTSLVKLIFVIIDLLIVFFLLFREGEFFQNSLHWL